MQTISQRWKSVKTDTLLLSINFLLIVAFNLSLYFLFVKNEPQWIRAVWCLAGLIGFWTLLWNLGSQGMSQKSEATVGQTGGTQLTLVTLYSLLNGLSYLWLPDQDVYITVFLQSGFTLIVCIAMSLSLVDQTQAGCRMNWPAVICCYLIVLVTLILNLTGLWLMLTGGV
ncbi:MAG: hypothetical protein KDA74_04560 [Planctomycetaceae bacterium]|nr:hypothetical protein [Planctomycetaceae bacterium]